MPSTVATPGRFSSVGKLTRSPRGYISSSVDVVPMEGNGRLVDWSYSEGDKEVSELFDQYMSGSISLESWKLRCGVITSAVRLIGDFRNFLRLQEKFVEKEGYRYEFLQDTLRFLRTGQRQVALPTWYTLVEGDAAYEPNPTKLSSRSSGAGLIALLEETGLQHSSYAYLSEWCLKPAGVNDLLCTLHVLFGKYVRTF